MVIWKTTQASSQFKQYHLGNDIDNTLKLLNPSLLFKSINKPIQRSNKVEHSLPWKTEAKVLLQKNRSRRRFWRPIQSLVIYKLLSRVHFSRLASRLRRSARSTIMTWGNDKTPWTFQHSSLPTFLPSSHPTFQPSILTF